MKKVKHVILLMFCIIAFSVTVKAQEQLSFVIINDGGLSNIMEYVSALKHNDLDKFRHINLRTVVHFNTGVYVELLSATEMQQLGMPVDLRKVSYAEEHALEHKFDNVEFILHPSGRILEKMTPLKSK